MNVGDKLGKYTIQEHIKDGGMGAVYKVMSNGIIYAMKTILPNASADSILRFRREARMLQSVKSEHVIEVLDCDFNISTPYYIMPYCSSSLTTETTKLSFDEKIKACIEFCKGIQSLHEAGVCHRDIKPDNALFLNGVLKITDLGGGRFVNRDTATLTQFGYIGTQGYMPPEYNNDLEAFKKGTKQGDIYMIGKSLYYVMSNGGDVSNVDLSQVDPGVAPIIERSIKANLNDRYSRVEEIISELLVFQTAKAQLQQLPKSIDEILKESGAEKYEDLYNLLLQESKDERTLATILRKIDDRTLNQLFSIKRNQLNNYIGVFDYQLRNPHGQILFEDVEVYVATVKVMFTLCSSPYYKQKLLDLAFDLAIQYNRYPAMIIIGEMLGNLSDEEACSLGTFFVRRKDDIIHMRPNFNVQLHYIIRNLIGVGKT